MEPNKPKTTAKDFFLHLGTMVALYAGTVALLNLLFQIINAAFPVIDRYFLGASKISLPVATLIVVFPLYLFLVNILQKGYIADPSRKEFSVRKWLVWITLFVTGIVIAGDLITLIYFFLDGRELTTGFILKVVAVFVVAGSIFGYYMDDLRGRLTGQRRNLWRIVSVVLVIGSIVAGFSIIGSPKTQRLLNYDQQKVSDLQNIQSQVIQYWQQKGSMPENLDDLRDPLSYFVIPTDSQRSEEYIYNKIGTLSFEICAEFNLASQSSTAMPRISNAMKFGMENENWMHGAGQFCFERTVDPQRYPVYPKPVI
jgi:hypothetical protein